MYLVEFWLPVVVGTLVFKSQHEVIVREVVEGKTGFVLDGTALPKGQVSRVTKIGETSAVSDVNKIIEDTYREKMGMVTKPIPPTTHCREAADIQRELARRIEYITVAFSEVHGRDMFSDERARYIQPLEEMAEFAMALLKRPGEISLKGIGERQVYMLKDAGIKAELEIYSQEPPAWLKKSISKNRKRRDQ